MAAEDNSWRTHAFRQSVVSKIDEAIQRSGMATARNSMDMENHVFQKAKTREEYLGLVARLILHVREMNTKKGAGMNPNQGQAGPGMPDPINALQNLASQGTRNNQMMGMAPGQAGPMGAQNMNQIPSSNLLQTLNRPGQNVASLQGLQGQMGPQMNQQLSQTQLNPMANLQSQMTQQLNPQVSQINLQTQMSQQNLSQQMSQQMPANMAPQMSTQLMGGQMAVTGTMPGQMGGQMGAQMGQNMAGQLGGQMHMQRQGNASQNFPGPRNPTPTQFLTQSPTQSVQSPASSGPLANQMVSSPALVPSPSPQVGMIGPGGPQRSVGLAASPSSSLNTPGQPTPSPMGMQEEQAYREKVRQLSKYIEPLRKMIARMGNDGEHVEKLSKMKKLLEILSNPNQRMALETLIKCEVVLEKLDFKRGEGSVAPVTAHLTLKEHHIFNPLLEACSNNLQSPVINHTMHRTFGPALEALFGPEIKLVQPLKKNKIDESQNEIPDALQGEIARLDPRFKVAMNPLKQLGSRSIQLLCYLDDKHLPCVPPISLTIPEEYPKNPPSCYMSPFDYNATQFLKDVQKSLLARIEHLPKHFSVSQLLTTWEMSVRQACAPIHTPVSAATVLMGL